MMYVVGLFVPPLAILLSGKLLQAIVNLVFWSVGLALSVFGVGVIIVIACVIHAWAVIGGRNADRRTNQLVKAIERNR